MTEQQHPENSSFTTQWLIVLLLGGFITREIYQGYAETGTIERERLSVCARIKIRAILADPHTGCHLAMYRTKGDGRNLIRFFDLEF